MNTLAAITRYQMSDALRSRWIIIHFLLFLAISEGLLLTAGMTGKALVSLINVTLFLVPLLCLVFGTVHFFNARDFVLLLLTQPVKRRDLSVALLTGLALPLAGTFALGIALPFLWHGLVSGAVAGQLLTLVGLGVALILIFTAVAFLISVRHDDRVRGIGVALITWMLFALVYDGLILLASSMMAAYPLEQPMLAAMLLNPLDLARLVLLTVFDAAAMMGVTGALFVRFFGTAQGIVLASVALLVWMSVPALFGLRRFSRRDF